MRLKSNITIKECWRIDRMAAKENVWCWISFFEDVFDGENDVQLNMRNLTPNGITMLLRQDS